MKALFPVAFFLFAASAFGQMSLADGLRVNGVGLGAEFRTVVGTFGKPVRESTSKKPDECTGSRIKTLNYPGLKIELDDAGDGFKVFAFEVTSASYEVTGVRVGDSPSTVGKRFGTRGRSVERRKAGPMWFYDMSQENPGGSTFYFSAGRVVKIQSTYQMC